MWVEVAGLMKSLVKPTPHSLYKRNLSIANNCNVFNTNSLHRIDLRFNSPSQLPRGGAADVAAPAAARISCFHVRIFHVLNLCIRRQR